MHDLPVNRFVIMDGDIPETHGVLHSRSQLLANDPEFGQCVKGLAHGGRRWNILARNYVSPDIHTELHSSRKVERKNILGVQIPRQYVSRRGTLLFDSLKAAPEGF